MDMRRKTAAFFLLTIFSVSLVSAAGLEASIKSSCGPREEPMVSISDLDSGHVGAPGHYSNDVCVKGARDFNIRQDCNPEEVRVFSIFSPNNTHVSIHPSFTMSVCSKSTRGTMRGSCLSNETAAFTAISDNNTHVGGIGQFSQKLCLFKQPPENVTLSISGLSGSFQADDTSISQGETIRIAEYPYVVAENSGNVKGIVSYTDFIKLTRSSSDTVSVTQSGPTFLVPFTEGDHDTIEQRQQLVLSGEFLDMLNPSFSFFIPDQPTLRVTLKPDQEVEGFTDTLTGEVEIAVQNKGLQNGNLVINMEPT